MKASDKPVTHGELETILDKAFAKFALQMGDMLADFAGQVDERFTGIEKRLGRIETRLDRVEVRLDSLEREFQDFKQETRRSLAEINQRLDKLERHTAGLEDDITYLYKLVENLKKDLKSEHLSESETRTRLEEIEVNLKRIMLRTGVNPA